MCGESRMHGAERGEKSAITSKDYLSLSASKSQGIKQLMAGGGVALIGITLIPLLSGLLSTTT